MPTIKTFNNIDIIIDEQDWAIANKYKWHVHKWGKGKPKVVAYQNKKKLYFSKTVFDIGFNQAIIHKNGNIFDYRRGNIIICTKAEVAHFRPRAQSCISQYYGVTRRKEDGMWWASPWVRKNIYGGRYDTEEEAAIAVDYLILKHNLKYRKLNFPQLTYEQLDKRYKEIRDKYGYNEPDKASRDQQGKKRGKNTVKSSQFVGVSWSKHFCKWESYITFKRKKYNLGLYESEIEAAKAYNKKAIELYGEKAKINSL